MALSLFDPPVTTSTLAARAADGDQLAFVDLIEPHRRMLWSLCLRVTGNPHDAEDALQECLLAAWRGVSGFRGESGFGTWLYRIAARTALAVARRRARILLPGVVDRELRDHSDASEAEILIRRGLLALPPIFREALILRELCDFSYQQIADHQGVGVQTVKSRLSRARARLREALGELDGGAGNLRPAAALQPA